MKRLAVFAAIALLGLPMFASETVDVAVQNMQKGDYASALSILRPLSDAGDVEAMECGAVGVAPRQDGAPRQAGLRAFQY